MATPTVEEVRGMSSPDLVRVFNELTGASIKRFSTRGTGVRRVLAVLGGETPSAKAEPPEVPFAETKPKAKRKPRQAKGEKSKLLYWAPSPKAPKKVVVPGSSHEKVFKLLQKGADRAEIAKALGVAQKRVIWFLVSFRASTGYGIREREDGTLQIALS